MPKTIIAAAMLLSSSVFAIDGNTVLITQVDPTGFYQETRFLAAPSSRGVVVIVKKENRYIVTNTKTKEVISEHPFEDNKKSMAEAEKSARESNAQWKESQ